MFFNKKEILNNFLLKSLTLFGQTPLKTTNVVRFKVHELISEIQLTVHTHAGVSDTHSIYRELVGFAYPK